MGGGEIGFGPGICSWIDTLYSDDAPPRRRVVCNGHRGEFFELHSGVAQGCPLSPILFLLITEGLTRLVNDDPELEGITILGKTYKISQFADDTVFLLRNFDSIRRMWQLITGIYEPATGMKVNVTKTEGLRMGRLKREAYEREIGNHVHTTLRMRGSGVVLRSFDEFSETDAGLPYSLWALPDCSWWLGWLVWLVRLWGTQVFVSLSLKMSRNTIRVFVVPPL